MHPQPAESPARKVRGTILIAFLMYLTTGLILWFVGLPSMALFDRDDPVADLSGKSLDQYLAYARDQAIQRQRPVTVCGSANGLQCAADSQWTQGWIVFVDADRHPGQLNPEDELLHVYLAKNQEAALGIDAKYVRYLANGVIELD
jgi:type IV fimbrial biogenesis protein FimT